MPAPVGDGLSRSARGRRRRRRMPLMAQDLIPAPASDSFSGQLRWSGYHRTYRPALINRKTGPRIPGLVIWNEPAAFWAEPTYGTRRSNWIYWIYDSLNQRTGRRRLSTRDRPTHSRSAIRPRGQLPRSRRAARMGSRRQGHHVGTVGTPQGRTERPCFKPEPHRSWPKAYPAADVTKPAAGGSEPPDRLSPRCASRAHPPERGVHIASIVDRTSALATISQKSLGAPFPRQDGISQSPVW
jgi:hypothetical protein